MNWNTYYETIIYIITGLIIFTLFIIILEKITPWSLKKELLEDENVALAIIIGSIFIAIGLIIASAIQG